MLACRVGADKVCRVRLLWVRKSTTSTLTVICGMAATVSLGAPSIGLISTTLSMLKPKRGKVEKKVSSTLPISCSHFTYSLATPRTIGVSRSGVNTTHTTAAIANTTTPMILPNAIPNIFNAFFMPLTSNLSPKITSLQPSRVLLGFQTHSCSAVRCR